MKASAAREAVRLVLEEGLTRKQSAERVGLSAAQMHRAMATASIPKSPRRSKIFQVTMTPAQHAKVIKAGGAKYVRKILDDYPETRDPDGLVVRLIEEIRRLKEMK